MVFELGGEVEDVVGGEEGGEGGVSNFFKVESTSLEIILIKSQRIF